jgi:uncharacterized repeat protein (TIGR01451 family)
MKFSTPVSSDRRSPNFIGHLKVKKFVASIFLWGGAIGTMQFLPVKPSQAGSNEFAGITITSINTPTAINGSVANFDFKIKNIGNDPTKFFLPKGAAVVGGALGTLQVVAYIPPGGTPINLATPINIPSTGASTGNLSDPTLGGNTALGSIPVDAAIVVRVPVTVNVAAGFNVSVTLGDTTSSPTNSNTPYIAGANDVYTVDNADTVAGEIAGSPNNGDSSGNRQEASAVQTTTVVSANTTTSTGVIACSAAGGTLGANLLANNGSFGTGSSTPGTTGSALPPGTTTYSFVNYGTDTPQDGSYSIVNQLNKTTFNYWFNPVFGHTTGAVNDQMFVVNAAVATGTFYTETVNVSSNQNMNLSFWVMNLPNPSSGSWSSFGGTSGNPNIIGNNKKPNISLMINRIGIDDNNDGTIDEPGEGQIITTTGAIPFTTNPTWVNFGALVNTGNATRIEFRFVNNGPGGLGNDLAMDDLMVAPCVLPSGNITGTLYRDKNTNNTYDSSVDLTMPANIAVNLKNSNGDIVATTYTDTNGDYRFINVPVGSYYTLAVALTDTDLPNGATAVANPSGANTTGVQSGVVVTANSTLANQNFGFSPFADVSAGSSFSCDADFYMLHDDSSNHSQLYRINRNQIPYGETKVVSTAIDLNALGYNKQDGYFYAMSKSTTNHTLYRIGQSGAVLLGTVSGLPVLASSGTPIFNNGTFDDQGNYYIRSGSSSTFYKIRIVGNTATATPLTISGVVSSGDIAFNPVDRKIYAVGKTNNDTSIAMSRIDPATSLVTNITVSNTVRGGSIASVFFDSSGTLYAYSDSPSYFFQMPDVASSSNTSTVTEVAAASAGSTDGASCPSSVQKIDVVKSADPIVRSNTSTFNIPFTIKIGSTGSSPATNVQVTENLAAVFSAGAPTITVPVPSMVTSGNCTANTSFDGKTAGKLTLLSGTNTLPVGASCTITFTARVAYNSVGLIPASPQNNIVYASTTSGSNAGHTFTGTDNTVVLPPNLYDTDTSTNGSSLPSSVHGDIPNATPLTFKSSNLLLVKRVTAIGNTPITTYIDDIVTTKAANDNNPKWPLPIDTASGISKFLVGSLNTSKVAPNQEIEYTIYFLSSGNVPIKAVNICDLIPANTTYAVGSGSIKFGTAAPASLTTEFIPAGAVSNTTVPGIGLCKSTIANPQTTADLSAAENPRGLVWVQVDKNRIPLAAGEYGYIRFRVLTKP